MIQLMFPFIEPICTEIVESNSNVTSPDSSLQTPYTAFSTCLPCPLGHGDTTRILQNLYKTGEKEKKRHKRGKKKKKRTGNLNHLISLPPGSPQVLNTLTWMRLGRILILSRIRVGVHLLQIAQSMVHLAVLRLVRADIIQQILDRPLSLRHLPVLNGDLGRLLILPMGELPRLKFLDGSRVGDDGFFFEISDEAVAGARGHQVGEEEAVEEDALRAEDEQTHGPFRFGEFHER